MAIIAESMEAMTSGPVKGDKKPFNPRIAQTVNPTHTFDNAPDIDVLLVPGGWGAGPTTRSGFEPNVDKVVKYIKDVFPKLQYLISGWFPGSYSKEAADLCSGVYGLWSCRSSGSVGWAVCYNEQSRLAGHYASWEEDKLGWSCSVSPFSHSLCLQIADVALAGLLVMMGKSGPALVCRRERTAFFHSLKRCMEVTIQASHLRTKSVLEWSTPG
jgi:hypothetical protein